MMCDKTDADDFETRFLLGLAMIWLVCSTIALLVVANRVEGKIDAIDKTLVRMESRQ